MEYSNSTIHYTLANVILSMEERRDVIQKRLSKNPKCELEVSV